MEFSVLLLTRVPSWRRRFTAEEIAGFNQMKAKCGNGLVMTTMPKHRPEHNLEFNPIP